MTHVGATLKAMAGAVGVDSAVSRNPLLLKAKRPVRVRSTDFRAVVLSPPAVARRRPPAVILAAGGAPAIEHALKRLPSSGPTDLRNRARNSGIAFVSTDLEPAAQQGRHLTVALCTVSASAHTSWRTDESVGSAFVLKSPSRWPTLEVIRSDGRRWGTARRDCLSSRNAG